MIIYQASKKEFMDHVTNDEISIKIYNEYQKKVGKTKQSEIRSWTNSMDYMFKVLSTPEIPDECGVAIEYRIPATSKRVDFILSGLDENDKGNVIIVELKQWDTIEPVNEEDGIVKTVLNSHIVKTSHPSYQAWSYSSLIEDYNDSVEKEDIKLHPCAYLHNYIKDENYDPIVGDSYHSYVEKAPVYTRGDAVKLRNFICKYIKKADHKDILYKIEGGKIRPSKSLQDVLLMMLDGSEEFIMIDDQKVVYESIMRSIRNVVKKDDKQVIIVEGGPGTGKSVLAINLLVKATARDLVCHYVTKNSAPRSVYEKKLKGRYTQKVISNLFKGSGVYIDTEANTFDVLIVDEAHRLNEKSGIFKNQGENQIKEIINAAKVSVFFLDENQRVTIHDIGTRKDIERFAYENGAKVRTLKLESQFRCNGSDGYLAWVDDVLAIRDTANFDGFEFDYDFRVLDNPNEIFKLIKEKNAVNNKSRMVAGYCWEWITKNNFYDDKYDVEIKDKDFRMKWNFSNSSTWAIDESSVNELGCIHTCQGLEFDYVGVIIGEDIRYENGCVVTDFFKRAKTDKSLSGIKKMYKQHNEKALKIADEIIKNTYRTLMTRGVKGCYVYCVDPGLQQYFKERLNMFSKNIEVKDIVSGAVVKV
ncbi:MAG: DUF2075 domain-containing protein [Clostridiaceae bacterium]